MKKVIAACIERILDFVIVSREEAGGKCRIRVKEQYNKSPMIQD